MTSILKNKNFRKWLEEEKNIDSRVMLTLGTKDLISTYKKEYLRHVTVVIVNNDEFGKDYVILNKDTGKSMTPWSYPTVKEAEEASRSKGFKISREW